MPTPKQENPLSNLFFQLEKIMQYVVVKNNREAEKYETVETARDAALYLSMLLEQDNYMSYARYYEDWMFQEVDPTLREDFIGYWLKEPSLIPGKFRDHLKEHGREIVLNGYVEKNDYYRMLMGEPPLADGLEDFIYVPEAVRASIHTNHIIPNVPMHMMQPSDQEAIVNWHNRDDYWFQKLLENHPDKPYLRYMGNRRIDPFVARRARDFQLIRYMPMEDSGGVNPYLLKEFATLYDDYRDYVVFTLYNREFEDVFENYRPFMALLITAITLMQICNKSVEHMTDFRFLDDKIIATVFDMYSIPRSLIVTMTAEVQRKLATNLMKLIRGKATNTVLYDVVNILGMKDVTISKLMLMRQQKFDEDGTAIFSDGSPILTWKDMDKVQELNHQTNTPTKELALEDSLDDEDWERVADQEEEHPLRGLPHFQAVDLKDKNPYASIVGEKSPIFDYHSITSGDPRWWDLQETRNLIRNKHYTNADSKYIMVESMIRETEYLYEIVYFMRMILDNKSQTDQIMIAIPELFGVTKMSLFDLMVFLLAAMSFNNGLDGTIITSASGLLAVAGFNFEIDMAHFTRFLEDTEMVDKEKVMEFMRNITVTTPSSIKFIYDEVMIPFRDWLTLQVSQAPDVKTFREYDAIYRSTFSYDIAQQVFITDFIPPIDTLLARYDISREDMQKFQLFYPHSADGKAMTIDEFYDDIETPTSQGYNPFLGNMMGQEKTWYVETGRGNLYFYDVLNSTDLRYVIDENGKRVPNPVFWNGTTYDTGAIETAINGIRALPPNELGNAFFKVDTLIPDTYQYIPGIRKDAYGGISSITYLPDSITAERIFKDILIDKIELDMSGEAEIPATYEEYLRRRNPILHDLFKKAHTSKNEWLSIIMIIVLAIEAELDMYLKYFEQAVAGNEMFFKPLITLIKYFKSYMIDFSRCSLKYIFDSKADAGGGSNMLKLFDDIYAIKWYIFQNDEFGLYDTEHLTKHRWLIKDRAMMIKNISGEVTELLETDPTFETKYLIDNFRADPDELPGTGGYSEMIAEVTELKEDGVLLDNFKATPDTLPPQGGDTVFSVDVTEFSVETPGELIEVSREILQHEVISRRNWIGSLRMVDEAKFFLNGREEEPDGRLSFWLSGEEGVGRFDMEHDRRDAAYDGIQQIKSPKIDIDGWKEFVEPPYHLLPESLRP